MTRTQATTPLPSLIASHGAPRVLVAALVAMLFPRAFRPLATQMSELDDHLRRDIGLPPIAKPPDRPGWLKDGW
jgi:hypothetical protein